MPNYDYKQIATELCERFSSGDIASVLELLTDDVQWFIPGNPEHNPSAGDYDKAKLGELLRRMYARFEGGISMRALRVLGDADRLALEAESSAELRNGRKYRQAYHFSMQIRDRKIARVREYFDTLHVYDTFYRP